MVFGTSPKPDEGTLKIYVGEAEEASTYGVVDVVHGNPTDVVTHQLGIEAVFVHIFHLATRALELETGVVMAAAKTTDRDHYISLQHLELALNSVEKHHRVGCSVQNDDRLNCQPDVDQGGSECVHTQDHPRNYPQVQMAGEVLGQTRPLV